MYKKLVPLLAILLLIVAVAAQRTCSIVPTVPHSRDRESNTTTSPESFNRDVEGLEYTKHARCRMDCRAISERDVEEILLGGSVDRGRSDFNDKPCPTFAIEGYTMDREHLRVVFAQCRNRTRVVTCINLDEDFACHCPGDQQKRSALQ